MDNIKLEPEVISITLMALDSTIEICQSFIKKNKPLSSSEFYKGLDLAQSAKSRLMNMSREITLNELKIIRFSLFQLKDYIKASKYLEIPIYTSKIDASKPVINKALRTFRKIAENYGCEIDEPILYN